MLLRLPGELLPSLLSISVIFELRSPTFWCSSIRVWFITKIFFEGFFIPSISGTGDLERLSLLYLRHRLKIRTIERAANSSATIAAAVCGAFFAFDLENIRRPSRNTDSTLIYSRSVSVSAQLSCTLGKHTY